MKTENDCLFYSYRAVSRRGFSGDRRGFSMVEMMVTIAIFLIISGGAYAVTFAAERIWSTNLTRIDLHQNLRKAMEGMIYELRQTGPGAITDVSANGTWYTQITFKKPSDVTGGALVWNAYTTKFQLGGTDAAFLQKVENGTTTTLATDMKVLRFRRQAASPSVVEVYIQGEKTTPKGEIYQHEISFSVDLRNS